MTNRSFFTNILLPAICLWQCKQAPKPPHHPADPEAVVRQWQQYIDSNNFDAAKQLSTGDALSYLGQLDTLEVDSTVLFNFKCVQKGDSAECTYWVEDELGERFPEKITLLHTNQKWFVAKIGDAEQLPADSTNADQDMIEDSDDE